jgi:pyruvate,water dikinase
MSLEPNGVVIKTEDCDEAIVDCDLSYIREYSELNLSDVSIVGGKNASLGEMYSELTESGINVPNGFAIKVDGYTDFIEHNDLSNKIEDILKNVDIDDIDSLFEIGKTVRSWFINGEMPGRLESEILQSYYELGGSVAIRSSATTEDSLSNSFAGQLETYLNVFGAVDVIHACKLVFASLFTDRVISYRISNGYSHKDVKVSIGIQEMVRSDRGTAGVMFTLDTESGFEDVVLITGAYGLGENVVSGNVNPDEFYVFKPTLKEGYNSIIQRHLGTKLVKMIYSESNRTNNIEVDKSMQHEFCLSDDQVISLAKSAVIIEDHYSKKYGKKTHMDIEWAIDGITDEIFIVQSRPETVHSADSECADEVFTLKRISHVITTGKPIGSKIGSGTSSIINDVSDMNQFNEGDILVTDITDPDWEPIMKKSSGIITNRGGRTCHAAIIARELGIPAVVGCDDATSTIKNGEEITISCAEGEIGYVYNGLLPYTTERIDFSSFKPTKTKLMLNLGNPDMAFKISKYPNEGIGLARLEFIINSRIGIHPNAILNCELLSDEMYDYIMEKTIGYSRPTQFYRSRLADGIATIAASVYPKPVIFRLSDFKSNEYSHLYGGQLYEPIEENPMLGFRGAYRYNSPEFKLAFELECSAIRKVILEYGLNNIQVMVPFIRTVNEAKNVIQLLKDNGIKSGENGIKIIFMCEIPANALLADEFLEYCDGFSIGSNDLTQLTLGVDRDSSNIDGCDERNEAVLKLMEMAIKSCKKHGKYIGICGQAPSDFPEITSWLVNQGIDSLSLNYDSILTMNNVVRSVESEIFEI